MEHRNSLEDFDPEQQESAISRRVALGRIMAGTSSLAFAALQPETANAAEMDYNSLKENLEKAGYLVLDFDSTMEGNGILAPSAIKPLGYNLVPIQIVKQYARTGKNMTLDVWVPTPDNFCDQRNVGIMPFVLENGKLSDRDSYTSELTYAKPDNNGHRNIQTKFHVNSKAKNVVVGINAWVMMPIHNRDEILSNRVNDPAVNAGLSAASSLRYDGGDHDVNPGCGRDGKADCGGKAKVAKDVSGRLEFVEGFRIENGNQFSPHVINCGLSNDGKLYSADAGSGGNITILIPNTNHLATGIGEFKAFDSDFSFNGYHAVNAGAWKGRGARSTSDISVTRLSGVRPAKEVAEYAAYLQQLRK